MKEKISGIYKITNTINKKFYIGSSVDINSRWTQHKNKLNRNKHSNAHIQRAWNKYNKINFVFEIIELVKNNKNMSKKDFIKYLIEKEQYWIDLLKPYDRDVGYNINIIANSRLHLKESDETKRKKSVAMLQPHHQDRQRKLMKEIRKNRTILLEPQVFEILELIHKGLHDREIAQLYNVSQDTICSLRMGKSWSSITNIKYVPTHSKIGFEEKQIIFNYFKQGYKNTDIVTMTKRGSATIVTLKRQYKNLSVEDMVKYGLIDEII